MDRKEAAKDKRSWDQDGDWGGKCEAGGGHLGGDRVYEHRDRVPEEGKGGSKTRSRSARVRRSITRGPRK